MRNLATALALFLGFHSTVADATTTTTTTTSTTTTTTSTTTTTTSTTISTPPAICGDGAVGTDEECDDANASSADGCDSGCVLESGWTCPQSGSPCVPICGDTLRRGAEECDDGNVNNCDGCSAQCRSQPAHSSWCLAGGPEGGPIHAVAVAPTDNATLYVGTRGGVFKSVDSANSWAAADTGIRGAAVTSLAVSPVDSQLVLAGAFANTSLRPTGVYRSIDGGQSWTLSLAGRNRVLWDPVDPNLVYAYSTPSGGFARSTDAGATWTSLPGGGGYTLAIDPSDHMTLYMPWIGGVLKSLDGGNTWSSYQQGLSFPFGGGNAIAVDPLDSARLLLSDTSGLRVSTDGGHSWSPPDSTGALFRGVAQIVFDPATPSRVLVAAAAGLFGSNDGGSSWNALGLESARSVLQLGFASTATDTAYAATGAGIFKSFAGATDWSSANFGLTAASVLALAADPATPGRIYAGTDAVGVWAATNDGATWSPINGDFPLNTAYVASLVVDPSQSTILYAGLQPTGGVFKTTDGGQTWVARNNGFTDPERVYIYGLAIDPATPSTLYATEPYGLFKTIDGGLAWSLVEISVGERVAPSVVSVDPSTPQTIYVIGSANSRNPGRDVLCKSTDAGNTWELFEFPEFPPESGVPTLASPGGTQIVIDATLPTTLYMPSHYGVFKSIDAGITWVRKSNTPVESLAIDPNDSSVVYATSLWDGLYKSTDEGETWTLQPEDGLTNLSVRTLLVTSPASAQPVTRRPLWSSIWNGLARALPPSPASAATPSSQSFLFAGAQGLGGGGTVFRKDITPCTLDSDCDDAVPCTDDVCDPSSMTCSHTAADGCGPTTTLPTTTTLPSTTTTLPPSTTTTLTPAGTEQRLSGGKLILKDNADTSRRGVRVDSRDSGIALGGGDGSADDPVVTPGSSLRVRTTSGCGGPCDTTYPLIATWTYSGNLGDNQGYRFKDKTGLIRSVTIDAVRRLKIRGKGALGHSLSADPKPVDVVLTIGTKSYCMQFGGSTSFKDNRLFKASDAPAPAECLP
jgi:cysteine-rich repeat protein